MMELIFVLAAIILLCYDFNISIRVTCHSEHLCWLLLCFADSNKDGVISAPDFVLTKDVSEYRQMMYFAINMNWWQVEMVFKSTCTTKINGEVW